MTILKIASFPLDGKRLIEASAGTGKTYTIAGLYLRLLIERKLTVTEILVVTFTEAATQELRGRIRQRIYDALLWLEGKTEEDDLSELLLPLKKEQEAVQRLRDALTCMDEASIYTIHGFCQRMLTDNAFESRVLFDADFITDEALIRQQVVRDFWRLKFSDATLEYAEWIGGHWKTPDDLLKKVGVLIDKPEVMIAPALDDKRQNQLEKKCDKLVAELQKLWNKDQADVMALLSDKKVLSQAAAAYKPDNLNQAYECLCAFLESEILPKKLPSGFGLFTSNKLASSLKKNQVAPKHEFFDKAQELFETWNALEQILVQKLSMEAAGYIRKEIDRRKSQQRVLFFDDLLNKLDLALSGDGQAQLAERIRTRYPVAMIDEFQDTDPLQYRIFHRIYQDCPECGLFMIGDPKQAIYSFRGADIFTYMQARHDTESQSGHFTLGINWRSHSTLVHAVNALFEKAQAPFIYEKEIGFHPVSPADDKGKADKSPLTINGKIPEPLVSWFVPMTDENKWHGSIKKNWASPNIASGCASEIARLLNLGQQGDALIGSDNVAAKDIAILVRDRYEAAHIRDALNVVGIASVYISRDSVFKTEEAQELTYLLHAVLEPGKALRTALATRVMGWDAMRIDSLGQDEMAWESRVQAFQSYQKLWREHGFMPMLHTLMRQEGIIAQLLSLENGERRMTNLLQLAELAQVASQQHPGIENLLRWLKDERAAENRNAEEQQLRMESDENLVKIVTIHKSKGLEYPIVFIPYIWTSKGLKERKEIKQGGFFTFHDEATRQLYADLGSDHREENLTLAERERLAEDLRLLYVALTRAKYRCYFSWGQFNGAASSAMAWLLHQSKNDDSDTPTCNMQGLSDDQICAALDKLNEKNRTHLLIQDLPEGWEALDKIHNEKEKAEALTFKGSVEQTWRMTSFTGLTQASKKGLDVHIEQPDYDSDAAAGQGVISQSAGLSRFSFPRGMRAGVFLHSLFETIDFPSATGEQLSARVSRHLAQYGYDEKWTDVLAQWVKEVLDTPLDETKALMLRKISSEKRLVEMDFHFPLAGLSCTRLNALLNKIRGMKTAKSRMNFQTVKGMMKGFIDLIFEFDGRFYVLDYKSNYIGDKLEDYGMEALGQAMVEHGYDLQYLIYVVALHRYLKQRLPDYNYEMHIGGVYYLFLRGMSPERGAKSGVYSGRPTAEEIEALNQLFMETEEVAHV